MAPGTIETAEAEQVVVKNIRRTLRKLAELGVLAGDTTRLACLTDKAFRQEFPARGRTDNRLANAIARGIAVRQKLIQAEGGSLSAEEAARLLGISKPAILKRYQKARLLAWREEKQDAVRFPVWQFAHGRVLEGIEEVIAALNTGSRLDDFSRMLFFLSTPRFLGGKRPLDCLRKGQISKALQAAQGYAG